MVVNQVIIPAGLKGTLKANLGIAPGDLEKALKKYVQDSVVLNKKSPADAHPSMRYSGHDVYFEYANQNVTVKNIK